MHPFPHIYVASAAAKNVGLVTVSAHVPYPPLGFLEFLGVGPVTILASHQERLSGVPLA